MSQKTDVVVVGGGAIGLCSTYYLWKSGRSVTLLEKGDLGAGSSSGNAGMIVPSHLIPLAAPGVIAKGLKWMFNRESPFYIKPRLDGDLTAWLLAFRRACTEAHVERSIPLLRDLSLASVALYDDLATPLDFGFAHTGLFMLYTSEKGRQENVEMARQAEDAGLDVDHLGADDLLEVDPYLRASCLGGLYYRQDAVLDPNRLLRVLGEHLKANGVAICTDTEVLGLEHTNGTITQVHTSQGTVVADQVVLAAGAWSPLLARDLQMKLPVQAGKGYSVTLPHPGPLPRIPAILTEAKVTLTPLGDRMRFGGTLGLEGLDASIDRRRVRSILRVIPDYLPETSPETLAQADVWSGFRPCTPDGLPLLGRPKGFHNLVVATGHAMIGITLAPITGKLVADMINQQPLDLDVQALRVDRFA